jgi:hypothetical protein
MLGALPIDSFIIALTVSALLLAAAARSPARKTARRRTSVR